MSVWALTADVPAVIAAAILEDAVSIVLLVLLLIADCAEVMFPAVLAVPAVIADARDDEALNTFALVVVTFVATVPSVVPSEEEALPTIVLVFAFTTDAILVEAVPTILFVFAFTAEVPAVIAAARELDAVSTVLLVLLLIAV
jgi:hypothetical protein